MFRLLTALEDKPNLTIFGNKFLRPQDLGVLDVGRSVVWCSVEMGMPSLDLNSFISQSNFSQFITHLV